MSFLKSIALLVISPTKLAFLLVVMGVVASRAGARKTAKIFYITAVSWLLVFSQPYVADLLLYPLEHGSLSSKKQALPDSAEFILPLACYYQTVGDVPTISRWPECSLQRLLQASLLAKQYEATLLLTGGHFLRDKTVNYAREADELLSSVDADNTQNRIVVGKGTSTRDELLSIKSLVGKDPIVVVTSATHSYRVRKLSRQLGLQVKVVGVNYHSSGKASPYIELPSVYALQRTRHAFYEYFAILKYHIETGLTN